MSHLGPGDVACWLLKSTRPPELIEPGWRVGTARELTRCVRRSYRLDLMRPGQPCLLWVSGRTAPGVHALGEVTGEAEEGDGGPVVLVRLTRLPSLVPRADLLADPAVRDAEVLRMPAGSNPSWLSVEQYAAVLAHLPEGAVTSRSSEPAPSPGAVPGTVSSRPRVPPGTLRAPRPGHPLGP